MFVQTHTLIDALLESRYVVLDKQNVTFAVSTLTVPDTLHKLEECGMSLNNYNLDLIEALDELSEMPGYDGSYALTYHKVWTDGDDSEWLAIFSRDEKLFKCSGGERFLIGEVRDKLLYEPISRQQVLKEIEDLEAKWVELNRHPSM
jgi:hypothetical protein